VEQKTIFLMEYYSSTTPRRYRRRKTVVIRIGEKCITYSQLRDCTIFFAHDKNWSKIHKADKLNFSELINKTNQKIGRLLFLEFLFKNLDFVT
jgi:hypothetical protein